MLRDDPTPGAVPFDMLAAEFNANPHPVYERLRRDAPVFWWETGNAWVLSRYDDVAAATRDRRFSTDERADAQERLAGEDEDTPLIRLANHSLLRASDEGHQRLRRLLAPTFSARAMEQWRVDIQRIVDETLDELGEADRVDVVSQFADLVPFRVVTRMLRIPPEQEATFRGFSSALIDFVMLPWLGTEEIDRFVRFIPQGADLLHELIAARRRERGDDLLSTLIHFEEQGDRLSTDELTSLIATLVPASNDSTVLLVAFTILDLLRHPEQRRLVLEDPRLLRDALDEVMRFEGFVKTTIPRYAREDVEIRGTTIRRGQTLYPLLASAMHDPDVFADPGVFDVRRDQTRSLGFGIGPHFCLGSSQARLVGMIAVGTFFARFPAMQLAGEPVFARHIALRKMVSLPVALRP
jgi:cytochrome P450